MVKCLKLHLYPLTIGQKEVCLIHFIVYGVASSFNHLRRKKYFMREILDTAGYSSNWAKYLGGLI